MSGAALTHCVGGCSWAVYESRAPPGESEYQVVFAVPGIIRGRKKAVLRKEIT
jgi:hypothetical protein